MATTSYNPFREMDRVLNQVTRQVAAENRAMPMDLFRKGDTFVVKMDLPGVDPSSIDIDVDDRTLTVRAERASEVLETRDEKNQWLSRERSFGAYARQLTLGRGLDLAGIEADYADGVLTLTVPVAEEAKPRKVAVRSSENSKLISGTVEDAEPKAIDQETSAEQPEQFEPEHFEQPVHSELPEQVEQS